MEQFDSSFGSDMEESQI